MEKIFIIIPTYNEADNIIALLDKIRNVFIRQNFYDFSIIVVDDSSPDGTAELVEHYGQRHQDLHISIINNKQKVGLGRAYTKGFAQALRKGAYAVVMMDADMSHDPSYLPSLINNLDKYDCILGSRYIKGGNVLNWDLRRKFISKFGNLYSQIILGVPLHDLTGGFNCYKNSVLRAINIDSLQSNGYSFQIEVKYRAFKKGFQFLEVPIIFKDRELGQSKLSGNIIWEAIFTPWKLRFGKN
jgi:dolichol-phosphate mannosyltransferase